LCPRVVIHPRGAEHVQVGAPTSQPDWKVYWACMGKNFT
jgi:hypothetical protein